MSFKCNYCKKDYESYQSRWNHIKKFHTNKNTKIEKHSTKLLQNESLIKNTISDKQCKYCNKLFTRKFSLDRHLNENRCQNKIIYDEIEKNKNDLKKEMKDEIKKQVDELISKLTIPSNNINNINNGTINNNIIFNINSFGKENYKNLTYGDLEEIYNSNLNCMLKFVEVLNFNQKYPDNHTFCTTSLEGDYVSIIDNESKKIKKKLKKNCYDMVLFNSLQNITNILNLIKGKVKPEFYIGLNDLIENTKKHYLSNQNHINSYNKEINEIAYNNKEMVLESWEKADFSHMNIEDNKSLTDDILKNTRIDELPDFKNDSDSKSKKHREIKKKETKSDDSDSEIDSDSSSDEDKPRKKKPIKLPQVKVDNQNGKKKTIKKVNMDILLD